MANYNIVLNLSGNAVTRVEKLAAVLATANANASKLATSLGAVGAAGRGVSTNPIRIPYNARSVAPGIHPANMGYVFNMPREANPYRSHGYQSRHPHTRIASLGTGVHFGPFSGRLSTILQPDENGMLFGMDAAKLMNRVNVTAIAGNIMGSIGKSLIKLTAVSTLAPVALGGGVMALAMRALQSESFAEGVRLISRRHQAKMGLGEDFEQAQQNADFLSKGYGFDRSTTLSSINVLTGLGVGGKSNAKITLPEATSLTKVGGIISQHHGVPFERVMTNIQQLLVQQTPHMRDIRELLNQAPILGKYAIKEMEEKGVEGVDVRTWFKNQDNILSALKRYELDTATNAGMQARGQISLASQDAWAKIAGNNNAWSYIGMQGASLISSIGNGLNGLLTSFTNNPDFRIMVKKLELTFDSLGRKGDTFADKLIALVDGLANRFGIDLVEKREAAVEVNKTSAIEAYFRQETIKAAVRPMWQGIGRNNKLSGETADRAFEQWYSDLIRNAKTNENLRRDIVGYGEIGAHRTHAENTAAFMAAPYNAQREANSSQAPFFTYLPSVNAPRDTQSRWTKGAYDTDSRSWSDYVSQNAYARYKIYEDDAMKAIKSFVEMHSKMAAEFNPVNGNNSGDDLTGINRDRRSLEIHFHDKLVEWNSTINASDPSGVVEEVADNIEQITASAVQKALLGASNKMSLHW